MSVGFWIRRGFLVLAGSFAIILLAQYLKTKNLGYALTQAAIWGSLSTLVYLVVLWRKLRRNPACAIRATEQSKPR